MESMKKRPVYKSSDRHFSAIKSSITLSLIFFVAFVSACVEERPRHGYTNSAEELEKRFGKIITVANLPTPDQYGTGDKIGLFRDKDDTFWGIPVSVGENQSLVGCAPPNLDSIQVSDTLPSDTVKIVGAANEPTDWRGGTGSLKLLLLTSQNKLRWRTVKAVSLETNSVCWSKSDPVHPLEFYRLVIADKEEKEKESSLNSNSQSNR
ncbi:MAG: hypothetical protein OEM82_00735 [Acidobacteriota bacterium]|nr:hypothetical protein [Acidobacteriota bacterium]